MFLIRSIEKKDMDSFFHLAAILDTYNLPKDRKLLSKIVHISLNSFQGKLQDLHQGRYVFVADDVSSGKVVGTSEIISKRGDAHQPFIFCEVGEDCMESKTLHRKMKHRYIKLHSTQDGPTEVGGLVVDGHYRGKGLGVGKALSYIRFMYMKAHPSRFQKRVLAELLAYLDSKGENPLWNFLGRHFTGLSYHEADRISFSNKEFIRSLFPSEKIYTCLLPERIQEILEKPGPDSVPAKILLERIGFKYLRQVDPFDGGPLYGAKTDQIPLVRETRLYSFLGLSDSERLEGLVLIEKKGKVRACLSFIEISKRGVYLNSEAADTLEINKGDKVWVYKYT
jgi:arginine N-succinyltransferase